MRFASLGSGSEGNGLVVEAGSTRVLMDCGFGLADSIARLARLKLEVADLAGIVVTHEHSDHIGGVGRLARKHKLPVWLTAGTLAMAQDLDGVTVRVIDSHAAFAVDDLEIQPFPVPHDAREPPIGDGEAPDLTGLAAKLKPRLAFRECHMAILECRQCRLLPRMQPTASLMASRERKPSTRGEVDTDKG